MLIEGVIVGSTVGASEVDGVISVAILHPFDSNNLCVNKLRRKAAVESQVVEVSQSEMQIPWLIHLCGARSGMAQLDHEY